MTKQYFKHDAESELGDGVAYFEFVGEYATRQVEVYGATYVWSDAREQSDDRFMIADQPLSVCELGSDHAISREEFELVWERARAAHPK